VDGLYVSEDGDLQWESPGLTLVSDAQHEAVWRRRRWCNHR
jgi:hypothetical protein